MDVLDFVNILCHFFESIFHRHFFFQSEVSSLAACLLKVGKHQYIGALFHSCF